MSVPDCSIDPRIIESAKKEFLLHGFEKASLKVICEKAGVTTGALYKRHKGKEDLFSAVVAATLADLDDYAIAKVSMDFKALSDNELVDIWEMDEKTMMWWFQFLYERHDDFVLLLSCAEGTVYSNFRHDWVEKVTNHTYLFFEEAHKRNLARTAISKEELHILQSAYYETIYEPIIHGFPWKQIEAHCKRVCKFFNWKEALELSCPDAAPR
jgi:Transcriptional regulator